mgnify:CR=1 FL=1
MKSKKRTIWILIVVIVILLGFASSLLIYRNKLSSDNINNKSGDYIAQSLSSAPSGKSIENFYDKPITDEKIALDSIEVNRNKLGYSDKNFTFIYDKTNNSETAYHFDLYYKDIPVYGGGGTLKGVGVFTHNDNSAKILMTSVSDSQKITKVNTTPKITEDEALNIAKETLGDNFSEYNISANFKQEKICPNLIIYETQDKYVLSYRIISNFYICIINAENGEVITSHSTIVANVSEYEGQNGDIHQVFYDDYKDENYDIKNALWNSDKGLFIFDNCIDGISLDYILKLDDIKDGNNKSAVDGMANTYRAIEYFEQENFGVHFYETLIIINNNKSKVNGKIRKDNATAQVCFIDNKPVAIITFDLRSKKNNAQLSAYLDVVGHEYTHAVTDVKAFGSEGYSTNSRDFERNALMEAYSDIFGQLIEQEYTGSTDWKSYNFRNIGKPEIKSYTKRYKTNDEGTEKNDYGYAHMNSTIISHAAYLMSKDNENKKKTYDEKYLLDYNQLGRLWYGSLEYLNKTDFMDFADCRWAVEQSARDLIENGVLIEDNLKVIEQAFNDVEVSSNPTRRGLTDSMDIIKDKNTIVVPIEDETQSTEFVEITEIENTTEDITNTSIDNTIEKSKIKSVSLGQRCSGCIDNNGRLYMWGNNSSGQLGNGTTNDSSTPIKIMDNIKEINLGGFSSSAITKDGSLYMWGGNWCYQLGNGTNENSLIPIKIMDNVKSVSLGYEHNALITEDGSLYMWGNNKHGKLGNGTTTDSSTPIKIMDNVKSVSLDYDYSGAITEDGSLYMWGGNWCYQLGNGTDEDSLTPIKIMDNVKSVTLGSGHNALITEDGSLYMWGYNNRGQVGNGASTYISPAPVESPVKIMDNVKSVSLGYDYSGAITEDGSLYMWGDNFYNQLGYSTTHSSTPKKIMDNIKSISFAYSQSSAITEDNVLYMWGQEINGTIDNVLFVNIGTDGYGCNHYGVIKTDGSLYMWGNNTSGECGNVDSETSDVTPPIKIEIAENS